MQKGTGVTDRLSVLTKAQATRAQIAIRGEGGLAAERQLPSPAAFAEHRGDLVVEVEVGGLEGGGLAAAGAGVQEVHDQGGVAAGVEVLAAQVASSRRRLSSGTSGTGCSGTIGGRMHAIGLGDLLFLLKPGVQHAQGLVAGRCG